MNEELMDFDKLKLIRNCLNKMKHDLAQNGAEFFNITIEDQFNGEINSHSGKAFSTDGKNIYGFTYDDGNPFKFFISRLFAGTYVKDKGISLYIVPFDDFFMQEKITDTSLDASFRPNHTKMHGMFWNDLARVDVTPETGKVSVETHLKPFVDNWEFWKSVDEVYIDRFVALASKVDSQDANADFIEKLYEATKNENVPECFADDDSAPNEVPQKSV